MKFIVDRASTYDGAPCDGAQSEPACVIRHDAICSTSFSRSDWEAEGYNHRYNERYATRDIDYMRWWIDIANLDELLAFQEKYGSLIVGRDESYTDNPLHITIYDSYVE